MGAVDTGGDVGGHRHPSSGGASNLLGTVHQIRLRVESLRRDDAHVHAELGAADHEGVGHVVAAIADIGESQSVEPADESVVTGWCTHGVRFAASVAQGNIHAVQFHPEAAPGPSDSLYLFQRFRRMMLARRVASDQPPKDAHAAQG